jgi:hypothetical protein
MERSPLLLCLTHPEIFLRRSTGAEVFRENKDIICQKERQCLKPYANKEEMNRCVMYVARVVKKLSNLATFFSTEVFVLYGY